MTAECSETQKKSRILMESILGTAMKWVNLKVTELWGHVVVPSTPAILLILKFY